MIKLSNILLRALQSAGVIIMTLMVAYFAFFLKADFSFTFRVYALLPLFAILTNVLLLFFINYRQRIDPYIRIWFSALLASIIVWGGAEFAQMISVTPEMHIFFQEFTAIGALGVGLSIVVFAIYYAGISQALFKIRNALFLIGPVFFLTYLSLTTGLLFTKNPGNIFVVPWGYTIATGEFFWVFLLFFEFYVIVALVILTKFYRETKRKKSKRQTKIFLLAIVIPLVGGTITNGIFPILEIIALPTAMTLTAIMNLVIFYGIYKYGLFSITPASIAAQIVKTMPSAVFVVNNEHIVEFVNERGAKMLDREANWMMGKKFEDFALSAEWADNFFTVVKSSKKKKSRSSAAEFRLQKRSGESVNVSVASAVLYEENGLIIGYIVVFTDISEIKEINEQLKARIDEIERLNSLLVGRELRMVELKQEIKNLRSKK